MALYTSGVQLVVQGTQQFINNLQHAGRSIGVLTRSMTSSPVNTFSSAITNLGAAFGRIVTTALGIGLYQITSAALSLIPTIEKLTLDYSLQATTLQGLIAYQAANADSQLDMNQAFKDAAPLARNLFLQYQKLAILSPFKTEDIINARVQLQVFGYTNEVLDELVPRITDVGSLFGWNAQKMANAAHAFGLVSEQGHLSGIATREFAFAAIDSLGLVAKYLGITRDAAAKMQHDGDISLDLFIKAFMAGTANAAGASERFAHTLPGLVSSLDDLRQINLREFGLGFAEAFLPTLQSIVDWLNKPEVQEGFHEFGRQVGEATVAFLEWGQTAAAAFGYWETGQISLRTFVDVLLPGLGDALAPILGPLESLTTWIGQNLPAAMSFLAEHSTELQGALLGVGALFAGGLGISIVIGLIGSLVSPIGLLIRGAALLGAAWAGNWGDIQGKTAAAWAVIQPALVQIYNWLATNIPVAVQAASNFWTTTLYPALQVVAGFIMTQVVPAITVAVSWLQTNLPIAMAAVSGFISGTLVPTFTAVAGWLGTNIPAAANAVVGFWNGQLAPALSAVWNLISAIGIPILNTLVSDFQASIGPATTVLSALWTNVLQPALSAVWDFISTFLLPVLGALVNVGFAVVQKAAQILAAIITNVVVPALSKVWDWVANKVSAAFKDLEPTIQGVGGVIQWLGDNALKPLTGWFDGIRDSARKLVGWLNDIAEAIRSIDIPDWARGKSPPPLAKWFDSIASSIEYAAVNALPAFQKAFAGMGDDIQKQAQDVQNAVRNMMESGYSAAADVDRQQAKNIEDLQDLSAAQQEYAKNELAGAALTANQFTNPETAAKYFQIRSKQTFEIAGLMDKYDKETDANLKYAIGQQINLISDAYQNQLLALEAGIKQENPIADLVNKLFGEKGLLSDIPTGQYGTAGQEIFNLAQSLQEVLNGLISGAMGNMYFPTVTPAQANTQGILATTSNSIYSPTYNYSPTYGGTPQNPQYDFELMRSIRR